MKNIRILLVVNILIIILGVSSIQAKDVEVGVLAPDFKLQDLSQDTSVLSSYRDVKPVILFFWTTWCPHCRKELSRLNGIYPDLVKDGLGLLTINIGESEYKVARYIQEYSLTFLVLLDKDTAVAEDFGILGVPTYIFIDRQGVVRFKNHYFSSREYKRLIVKRDE